MERGLTSSHQGLFGSILTRFEKIAGRPASGNCRSHLQTVRSLIRWSSWQFVDYKTQGDGCSCLAYGLIDPSSSKMKKRSQMAMVQDELSIIKAAGNSDEKDFTRAIQAANRPGHNAIKLGLEESETDGHLQREEVPCISHSIVKWCEESRGTRVFRSKPVNVYCTKAPDSNIRLSQVPWQSKWVMECAT